MKIILTCDNCGKEFERYASRKRGEHTFCSGSCSARHKWSTQWVNRKSKTTTKCDNCGKEFERTLARIREHNFCSYLCYVEYRQAHREYHARPGKIVHSCYLKEARAILEGKHWQGKNRCVKLEGDE